MSREPDGRAPANALATALAAQHHVLWGTQDPRDALADASEIVAAAQRAHDPETELDGHVLRLPHLLELGDGPPAQRVLPELDQLADSLNQPAARLAALSRRSTVAALTGDFGTAAELARRAFLAGQAAALPDAGTVYWGQMFAIWLHTGLPADDEQRMEQLLRDLVARSHTRTGHDPGVPALQPGAPMTGAAMALVIGVSWACVGDLFGVGDYGDLTDEGVFCGGAEEEVGDVCARG